MAEKTIQIEDTARLHYLCGSLDENLRVIEQSCHVALVVRGDMLRIQGSDADTDIAAAVIRHLLEMPQKEPVLRAQTIHYAVEMVRDGAGVHLTALTDSSVACVTAAGKPIRARTLGQRSYLEAIRSNTIVFGIGPAGTGKTFLAVAMAVQAMRRHEIQRIILTRPAVEAGEKLGFLPGDLQDKVDPYLRPLYDALFEMLGAETFQKHVERGTIEVAPLAYMRGRTLDNSFVILDEAQNTTSEQMKMFLTRLGEGSRMVITGDVTQIDLADKQRSGLVRAAAILQKVNDIAICRFSSRDVVRHKLVQDIIRAYERAEKQES